MKLDIIYVLLMISLGKFRCVGRPGRRRLKSSKCEKLLLRMRDKSSKVPISDNDEEYVSIEFLDYCKQQRVRGILSH